MSFERALAAFIEKYDAQVLYDEDWCDPVYAEVALRAALPFLVPGES
jgi:hypothetical protein